MTPVKHVLEAEHLKTEFSYFLHDVLLYSIGQDYAQRVRGRWVKFLGCAGGAERLLGQMIDDRQSAIRITLPRPWREVVEEVMTTQSAEK